MTTDDLADRCPVSDDDLARLHGRLAAAADAENLLDVAYRFVDCPLGSLLIAATPLGLVRVAFANEDHDSVLQSLSDRISPRVLRAPARLDAVAAQLDDYFAKRRNAFDVTLDWRLAHGFRQTVLTHLLADIDYGHTASYAKLAELSGSPRAVRAVGTACATNPIPIVVPCHRVVRSDGTMGSYRGGPAAKRTLLDLEAA